MCDEDYEPADCYDQTFRTARKSHECHACDETIEPGHRYSVTSGNWDGMWEQFKHCMRCHAMFEAIHASWRANGYPNMGVAMDLNCGEDWADLFGEPPPEVAALAFWLPGEVVPS